MKKLILIIVLFLPCISGFSQADNKLKELFEELKKVKADTSYALALFEIGKIYLFKGMSDSAAFYFEKMQTRSDAAHYSYGLCKSFLGLGNVMLIKNNYTASMNYFSSAFSLAEKNGFESEKAIANLKIGAIYNIEKQFDLAILKEKEAEKYFENVRDTVRWIATISDIGSNYSAREKWDESLENSKKGLMLLDLTQKSGKIGEVEFTHRKVSFTSDLAEALFNTNRAPEGVKLMEEVWPQIKNSNDETTRMNFLRTFAFAYQRNNQFDKAIEYANLGINACKEKDVPYWNLDFYHARSEAYTGLGDYKRAYGDYVMYKKFSDTVFSKEKFSVIDEMKTKYETEKKDGQIVQLNRQRTVQKRNTALAIGASAVLLGLLVLAFRSNRIQKKLFASRQQLETKERQIEKNQLERKMLELEQMALRAQMNPHFIFNCLNSVKYLGTKNEPELLNRYISVFAHLIRLTLDNSGRIVIPLKDEINYLEAYLQLEQMRNNNKFNYTVSLGDNIDTAAIYVPSMILQPFLENSIHHGLINKEGPGHILMSFSKNGKLECVIDDDGIGRRSAAMLKNMQPQAYESKGLALIQKRIETFEKIYKGHIDVQIEDKETDDHEPGGTRVIVQFPADLD